MVISSPGEEAESQALNRPGGDPKLNRLIIYRLNLGSQFRFVICVLRVATVVACYRVNALRVEEDLALGSIVGRVHSALIQLTFARAFWV